MAMNRWNINMGRAIWIAVVVIVSVVYSVEGQCTNATYPLELTASSVPEYLSSPDYPGSYPANSSCAWLITAPTGSLLYLNVEDITLSNTIVSCFGEDTLTIYDGENTTYPVLTQTCANNNDAVNSLFPTSSTIFITFASDSTPHAGAFNILYFANDSDAVQPDCNVNYTISLYASSDTKTLISPLATGGQVSCNLTFNSHLDNNFTFQFYYMNLLGGSCVSSSLTIYDGNSLGDAQLHQSCTEDTTYTFSNVSTSGTSALMVLDIPQGNYMVMLRYFTNPYTNETCQSSKLGITAVYNTENYIDSEGYGSGYSNKLRCRWLITTQNASMAVEAYFHNETFELEYNYYCRYDNVRIYDGSTSSYSNQMGRFCGSSAPDATYRTTGNTMLVIFRSDHTITKQGFRLVYKAVDLSCDSLYTEYDATYNVNLGTSSYRNISSPNYDGTTDYPRNSDVYWVLTNNNNTYYRIVVEIEDIKLEQSSDCIYDRVVAYNGSCTTDEVLFTACGSRHMRFDLYNEKHLIRFFSDGLIQHRGFYAYYYIMPPTTTTEQAGPAVEVVIDTINQALQNYSNDDLPTRTLSSPINATIDFYLVGINGLDEADQLLTSTGQFLVTWSDGNIAWDPTKRSNMQRMLMPQNDIWKPDIVLMNGVTKLTAMGASFMFVDIDYNGTCIWRPYQVLKTSCEVVMTNYPYDRQVCSIQFGTWSSSDNDVLTDFAGDGMKIHEKFTENSVWKLVKYETGEEIVNSQRVVKFTLTMARNPLYVVFYITIPLIMLAYINVFTFTIPTGSGEKSGFAITVFLSFVVVLIVISDSMPKNSENISLFAAYILAMTMMSALATCISVVQIRIMTLELFEYSIPPRIAKIVKLTKKIIKTITCFKNKKDNEVKSLKGSADDVKRNTNTSLQPASSDGMKNADSVEGYARYPNRRFSWLEDDDNLYAGQSTSSGTSTSMSTHSDEQYDLKLQRQLTAGSILLSNDDDSDAMFSDEEDDIEQMIKEITSEDNDPDANAQNVPEVVPESVDAGINDTGEDNSDLAISESSKLKEETETDEVETPNSEVIQSAEPTVETTSNSIKMTDNDAETPKPEETISETSNSNEIAAIDTGTPKHSDGIAETSNTKDVIETGTEIQKSEDGQPVSLVPDSSELKDGPIDEKPPEETHELDGISSGQSNASTEDGSNSQKSGKRVTFKDADDLVILDETRSQSSTLHNENENVQPELKRSNSGDLAKQSKDEIFIRPSMLKSNTVSEISLDKANNDQTKQEAQPDNNDTVKTEKQPTRSTSFFQTRPTLSGNRPPSHMGRPNSRLSRTDSMLSNRVMTPDINGQTLNKTKNPFTAPSKPFPIDEKQPFSMDGRESRQSTFYPETYADMDVYEWEVGNNQLLGDGNDSMDDEEEPVDDDVEEEEEDDGVTWEDVVDCSDVYLFLSYLIVTTLLTLAFFLPMLLAYS